MQSKGKIKAITVDNYFIKIHRMILLNIAFEVMLAGNNILFLLMIKKGSLQFFARVSTTAMSARPRTLSRTCFIDN